MRLPIANIPAAPPPREQRPVQANIPAEQAQREYLWLQAKRYVTDAKPTTPLSFDELREHGLKLLEQLQMDEQYLDFAAVLVNNAAWRDEIASIPYERRLLLLPKCMRVEATCPAPFDEFGLLCKSCGQCSLQDLQEEAERLGYAVLIAEGSALVMAIIETGKIDAIVGVSCLSVLEKAFPFMEAAAIPGVAVPLLQDDCKDTNVDMDWVWDIVHLTSEDRTHRLDLDALRDDVKTWFSDESLDELMGSANDETRKLGREWLQRDGKRWRPYLAAATYVALSDEYEHGQLIPDSVKRIAIAVECFHKASLVHDDIEDNDDQRYGEQTMHAEYGIPVALNVGDYLLGEGYRLIAESEASPQQITQMMQIAAEGHRNLTLGQGAELWWSSNRQPLSSKQVLGIFSQKTAPAFEVALRLGAVMGGADEDIHDLLHEYSENLGIAYQVRDDLMDWVGGEDPADILAARPSIVLAVAHERARDENLTLTESLWLGETDQIGSLDDVRSRFAELGVSSRCERLLDSYKQQCVVTLKSVDNPSLKGLLRRVIGKIFDDWNIEGWCRESEITDAAGRASGAESVA